MHYQPGSGAGWRRVSRAGKFGCPRAASRGSLRTHSLVPALPGASGRAEGRGPRCSRPSCGSRRSLSARGAPPPMPDHMYDRRWDRAKRGKRRFDDDYELTFAKRNRQRRSLPAADARDAVDGLPEGDRWSTWDQPAASERGPRPYPGWLVTELAATDTELGILKTGKEADVFLLRRGMPGTGGWCVLAANRYRSADH